jgi:hypothetical protein
MAAFGGALVSVFGCESRDRFLQASVFYRVTVVVNLFLFETDDASMSVLLKTPRTSNFE